MTSLVEPVTDTDWPTTDLYYSPSGLYGFQADGIAEAYLASRTGGGKLVVWDAGTGKTHFGMRMATLLAEDARDGTSRHDLVVLVCEKGKVIEWAADLATFTRLSTRIHHGPTRLRKLTEQPLPNVLITTYETAKADLAKAVKVPGQRGTSLADGPLLEAIEDLAVLWVCDEFTKLKNRSSANYKVFERTFRRMRKNHPADHRVFGLTATPIERDWEDAFSQIRLIRPDLMPTVAEFERAYVRGRDPYGRARYQPEYVMDEFVAMCRPVIMRKRKTDPDVIEQFPKKVEESMHVTMTPEQGDLYDLVIGLQEDYEEPIPGLWTVLRQITDHPASLVYSARHGTSRIAKLLVEEMGEERLLGMPAVKEAALVDYLTPLVHGQGAKAVVFTFFGQSVLPVLAERLRQKGFVVYENHGGLSATEMAQIRTRFRADPDPCVFLTSDAGSRGINLPEATYVIEYESALTYANRTQRLDRIHRIDSTSPSVTCMTLVVDETIESSILETVIARNAQTDQLLDDTDAGEHFMTSAERRAALRLDRLTKKRKKP